MFLLLSVCNPPALPATLFCLGRIGESPQCLQIRTFCFVYAQFPPGHRMSLRTYKIGEFLLGQAKLFS